MKTKRAGILAATTLALGLISPIEAMTQEAPPNMIDTQEQIEVNHKIQLPRLKTDYASLFSSFKDDYLLLEKKSEYKKQKHANEKFLDGKFWGLTAGLTAATIYDVETTYGALKNCENCREGNPITRPFVNAGRPAIYAFQIGINAGIMYSSYRLRKSNPSKKMWWLLPVIVIGAHSTAGSLNLRYVF